MCSYAIHPLYYFKRLWIDNVRICCSRYKVRQKNQLPFFSQHPVICIRPLASLHAAYFLFSLGESPESLPARHGRSVSPSWEGVCCWTCEGAHFYKGWGLYRSHVQADLSQKGLVVISGEYPGNICLYFLKKKARHSYVLPSVCLHRYFTV